MGIMERQIKEELSSVMHSITEGKKCPRTCILTKRKINMAWIRSLTASWPWFCVLGRRVWSSCILPRPSPEPASVIGAYSVTLVTCLECDWSAADSVSFGGTACPFCLLCVCCKERKSGFIQMSWYRCHGDWILLWLILQGNTGWNVQHASILPATWRTLGLIYCDYRQMDG